MIQPCIRVSVANQSTLDKTQDPSRTVPDKLLIQAQVSFVNTDKGRSKSDGQRISSPGALQQHHRGVYPCQWPRAVVKHMTVVNLVSSAAGPYLALNLSSRPPLAKNFAECFSNFNAIEFQQEACIPGDGTQHQPRILTPPQRSVRRVHTSSQPNNVTTEDATAIFIF